MSDTIIFPADQQIPRHDDVTPWPICAMSVSKLCTIRRNMVWGEHLPPGLRYLKIMYER